MGILDIFIEDARVRSSAVHRLKDTFKWEFFNLEFISLANSFLKPARRKFLFFCEKNVLKWIHNVEKYFKFWIVVASKFSFQSNLEIRFLNVYISYENDDLVMKCKTTVHPSTFLLIQSQSGARLFIGSFVTITYVNLLKTERREIWIFLNV